MRKSSEDRRGEDERYRSIIEYSPVSLWEEDISRLRAQLREMKRGAGFSLRTYLADHPGFVDEAVRLIHAVDVNQATLRLFEADRKEQLLGPLDIPLDTVSRAAFAEAILAIDEGRTDIEVESSATTLKGKKLSLIAKSHIPPADAAYPSMLVSLIDITARKQAEERERRTAFILQSILESAPDMVFVKDTALRTVLCNSAYARAVGKSPEDLYGKTDVENGWSVDLVKGNAEKGIRGFEKDDLATLSGQTIRIESEPADFDKGIRYFDTVKVPLRDPDGTIVSLLGIGRDVTERVKAEAEMRKARDFAENLIHTANVMVLCLDLEGRVTLFNETAERITGYSRAELAEVNWFETIVPKARFPEVWEKFEKLAHEGDIGAFENTILTKSGEERHIAWQNSQIVGEGRVTGTLSFGIDITDRRRMEEQLAWERGLFTMLMDNLPDQIYFKDKMSRFVRASRSHALLLGLDDPSQEVGKSDADYFSVDHAQKALDDEQRIIGTGEPLLGIEEKLTYPDRPDSWVVTSKIPLRDPAGRIAGTFGISHDITERKRLEAKNQQLATLVEFANDAIVGTDLERRVTVWNKGAERIYGYTAEEMIGATISLLIPSEEEEKTQIMGERAMRGEQVSNFETTRLRKDRSRVSVSMSLFAIRDPDGMIVGAASTTRDITQLKAMQAQLMRAQRLEGLANLARGVAHQFNNINTAVKSYLDLLQTEKSLPGRLGSYVQAASASVQKAVDITDRLLALTGSSAGASDAIRLDVLARTVTAAHQQRIEAEEVRLVLDLAETPPIAGDEMRLQFVLASLIDNAMDSLLDRPARTMIVRTGSTKDSAYFEIEDSGCGIPEEDMPRIFSPFFSAKGEWARHGSPQAKLKGVGLSLAISSTTVSEYGGRIDVRSTPGAGSTFRVVLPLASVTSTPAR